MVLQKDSSQETVISLVGMLVRVPFLFLLNTMYSRLTGCTGWFCGRLPHHRLQNDMGRPAPPARLPSQHELRSRALSANDQPEQTTSEHRLLNLAELGPRPGSRKPALRKATGEDPKLGICV